MRDVDIAGFSCGLAMVMNLEVVRNQAYRVRPAQEAVSGL